MAKYDEKNDFKRSLISEAISLLYEHDLLEADNEYGIDSWKQRAERLIIRMELYKFLQESGVNIIEEPPADYEFSGKEHYDLIANIINESKRENEN